MRRIRRIVIHCSATPEGRDIRKADIDRMHKANGWGKNSSTPCGYHYVLPIGGGREVGRREDEIGSHVAGFNADSIGICYAGGLTADGKKPKDTRTDAQNAELEQLLRELKRRYPGATICGHRDLSPDRDRDGKVEPHEWLKACPCFDVRSWLKEVGL